MMSELVMLKFETIGTGDAERDAIGVIPKVLKDLTKARAMAILMYLLERYKDGDNFGLE